MSILTEMYLAKSKEKLAKTLALSDLYRNVWEKESNPPKTKMAALNEAVKALGLQKHAGAIFQFAQEAFAGPPPPRLQPPQLPPPEPPQSWQPMGETPGAATAKFAGAGGMAPEMLLPFSVASQMAQGPPAPPQVPPGTLPPLYSQEEMEQQELGFLGKKARLQGEVDREQTEAQGKQWLDMAREALGKEEFANLSRQEKLEIQRGPSFSLGRTGAGGSQRLAMGQNMPGAELLKRLQTQGMDIENLPDPINPNQMYKYLYDPYDRTGRIVQYYVDAPPQYAVGAQQRASRLPGIAQEMFRKPLEQLSKTERLQVETELEKRFPKSVQEVWDPEKKQFVKKPTIEAAQGGGMATPRTLFSKEGIPSTPAGVGTSLTPPPPVTETAQAFLSYTGNWLKNMTEVRADMETGALKTLGPVVGRIKMFQIDKLGGAGATPEQIQAATRLHWQISQGAFADGGKQLTITEYAIFTRLLPTLEDTLAAAKIKAEQAMKYLRGKMVERARMLGYRQFEQLPEDVKGMVQEYAPREWQKQKAKAKTPLTAPGGVTHRFNPQTGRVEPINAEGR